MPRRSAAFSPNRAKAVAGCTALVALLLSACGAAEPEDPATTSLPAADEVRVADARFDGDFQVSSITVDGAEVGLISVPIVSIETEFGGLAIMPGCNTYFGSFSLGEDGTASFTIAGGSSDPCDELGDQEEAVLSVMRAAKSWEETADGFRFTAGSGDQLTVSR